MPELEKILITQQRSFPVGDDWTFGPGDERPEDLEKADALDKFLADAQLRGYGLNPEGIRKETAGIEQRANEIYRKTILAGAKTAPATDDDAHRLEKRFMGRRSRDPRTVRLEKSENGKWIMEYDERGELIAGHALGFWEGEK
jgi:hypothetical protein